MPVARQAQLAGRITIFEMNADPGVATVLLNQLHLPVDLNEMAAKRHARHGKDEPQSTGIRQKNMEREMAAKKRKKAQNISVLRLLKLL